MLLQFINRTCWPNTDEQSKCMQIRPKIPEAYKHKVDCCFIVFKLNFDLYFSITETTSLIYTNFFTTERT